MSNYATIAVIGKINDSDVAVWKISVSENGADLSGAWVFQNDDFESRFENLNCGLAIEVGNTLSDHKFLPKIPASKIDLNDFLGEANADVESGLANFERFVKDNEQNYAEYMAIEPSARKLLPKVQKKQLVPPEFNVWPKKFELKESSAYLKANGKEGLAQSGKEDLSDVLVAARVIQLFIRMWQSDEAERKNRIYVNGESAEVTILPRSWLTKLTK